MPNTSWLFPNGPKEKFKNPYEQDIRILSLGCHSHTQLFLLPSLLQQQGAMPQCTSSAAKLSPSSIYTAYWTKTIWTQSSAFGNRIPKISAQYRELSKIPIVCVCSLEHPLSQRQSVAMKDLKMKTDSFGSGQSPNRCRATPGATYGRTGAFGVLFCESIEAAIILSQAGFGISILPDLFIPRNSLWHESHRKHCPGILWYLFTSIQGNPPLRALLQIMRSRIEKNIPITNYH